MSVQSVLKELGLDTLSEGATDELGRILVDLAVKIARKERVKRFLVGLFSQMSPAQLSKLIEGCRWSWRIVSSALKMIARRIMDKFNTPAHIRTLVIDAIDDLCEILSRHMEEALQPAQLQNYITAAVDNAAKKNPHPEDTAPGGTGGSMSTTPPAPAPKADGHDHNHGHDHAAEPGAAKPAVAVVAAGTEKATPAENKAVAVTAAKHLEFDKAATEAIASLNARGSWRFAKLCTALRASHYRDPEDEIDGAAVLREGVRAFFIQDPQSAKQILENKAHRRAEPIHLDLAVQHFLGAAEVAVEPSLRAQFDAARDSFFDGQIMKTITRAGGQVIETAFDIVKVIGVAWALLWGTAIVSGIVATVAAMFDADAGSKFFLILTGVTFGLGLIPAGVFAAMTNTVKKPFEKIQEGVDKSAETLTKRFIGGGSDR